jgi:plastocyanin
LGAAGLATGVLAATGAVGGPGSSSAVSKVTVTASEFKFVLSKRSVPIGTVVFTVVNKGKISHNFKIGGKTTRNLLPGQKATLTVKFSKKGHYAYVCTIPGHATAGMKGVFSVATKPVVTQPGTTTQPTTTTTTPPPPTGTIGTTATTVQVGMFEYRFELSQSTVPSGQVTFVITNKGHDVHNFAIDGVRSGALLPPDGTETWTVGLPPGGYTFICQVPFHVARGMTGFLNVTS